MNILNKSYRSLFKLSSFAVKARFTFSSNSPSKNETQVPKFKIILNDDITIAKKQVHWRIRNMGQLEIEMLLLQWYDKHGTNLNLPELRSFTEEVLEMEIPDLNRYLLQNQEIPENSKYLKDIMNFKIKF